MNPEAADSPSSSLQVQDTDQSQLNAREERAAIRIQTAFRGFLVLDSYCIKFLKPEQFFFFFSFFFLMVSLLKCFSMKGGYSAP